MATSENTYSLVLRGRFAGKDRAVAQALSHVFGREDAWALQVVGASPITVLVGLSSVQAQAIHEALAEVEAAGCRFNVLPKVDEACPLIHWPQSPRINGRPIESFGSSGGGGELTMACPHCGKPIGVRLSAEGEVGAGEGHAGPVEFAVIPASLSPTPIPIPIPLARTGPAGGVPPSPIPAGLAAVPTVRGGGTPVQAPRAIPPVGVPMPVAPPADPMGNSGFEELIPMPRASQNTPPPGPLPEVPVVEHNAPPMPPIIRPASKMDPRMSGPMGLEEFEAGLLRNPPGADTPGTPGGPGAQSPSPPGSAIQPALKHMESGASLKRMAQEAPQALCSVFIGKNTSSEVHVVIAQIQGISIHEAQRLCNKPVVPVAKDITISEADAIKERLRAVNVNPRVTYKK